MPIQSGDVPALADIAAEEFDGYRPRTDLEKVLKVLFSGTEIIIKFDVWIVNDKN